MFRPCSFDPDWEESGKTYYNVTRGSEGFDDYYDTVQAYYWNSMCVPTIASYAILSMFMFLVLLSAFIHFFKQEKHSIFDQIKNSKVIKAYSKNISSKPLIGDRHAQVIGPKFLTIKLPLRGQTIILIGLFIANILPMVAFYKLFTKNNLYWSDSFVQLGRYLSDRSGIMATSQIPPLIVLSGRNNPLIWLTGISFEECMLYHRWIARFVFLHVLIHAIGYSIISVREGGLTEYYSLFVDPYFRWGCAATVGFGPLIFLSLRYLRQKSYEIFIAIHVLMAIVALVGTYYHIHLLAVEESGRYRDFDDWIYASIFFFAFDKVVRFLRIIILNVGRDESGIKVSKVEIDEIFSGQMSTILRFKIGLVGWGTKYKAYLNNNSSRFAQLWIPKLQPFSSHPFTIADVQNDQVYFYVKKQKGITNKLHKLILQKEDRLIQQTVFLEGFYGEVEPIEQFQRSLLIAGGIGITKCLPLFIKAVKAGKEVELFWIVRERGMMVVLIDVLQRQLNLITANVEEDKDENGKGMAKITVHVTNSYQDELEDDKGEKGESHDVDGISSSLEKEVNRLGITLSIKDDDGRPDVKTLINENEPTALFSCGPAGLCDEIRAARGEAELFEEAFEW